MKILLTGATGFVGTNLFKRLNDEHELITCTSAAYDLRSIANVDLLFHYRPEVVIHLAGSVGGIGANKENPGKFMFDNLSMGMNMIEMARKWKPQKFIMIGTVCSYPKFTPVPFKESELWNGYPEETNAPYGIAKKTLMKLIETYNEQYQFNGINLVPANMYGPCDHFNLTTSHVIPAIIQKVHNAKTNNESSIEVWGTGKASREFLYVDDFCDAVIAAIQHDPGPEPINIGTGKEITIQDLVKTICRLMDFDGHVVYECDKPDGQPRRSLDTTRALQRLDFKAKTPLELGLKQTITWYRENL